MTDEHTATRATAVFVPRLDIDLPHSGEERLRIVCIHVKPRAAGVIVLTLQHLHPVLAAIGAAIHTTFQVRLKGLAYGAGKDNVRIVGINDDVADVAGQRQAHVPPSASGVGRFVDAIAHRCGLADDERLACAGPDDIGIGRCDGQRTDRGDIDVLLLEDLRKVRARILCLPDAAGSGTEVSHQRIPRLADDGDIAIAVRA